jgi:crossover junction endodeoxyribonuclease RuvC
MALDGISLDEFLAMTAPRSRLRRLPQKNLLDANPKSKIQNLKSVRLLGIDPGTRLVGWGVIEMRTADRTLTIVDCGFIRPGDRMELRYRLRDIFSKLEAIIAQTRPHAAALEETFAGVNMKSAIAMGEGRGVALLCLARAGLDVLELSPRSIKQAVTGNGGSGKSHVAAMVAAHLKLNKAPEPEDITDALAAAIALSQRWSC